METAAAQQVTAELTSATGTPTEERRAQTVCELTNMVIGNAVTQLNNQGLYSECTRPKFMR